MGSKLKILREQRGWTQVQAAEAFGLSQSGYEKVERGERRLDDDKIERAATIYNVSRAVVLGDDGAIPIVGHIVRRGVVHLLSATQVSDRTAPRPDGATVSTVALLVLDPDALPNIAEENWYIYYDAVERGLPEVWIGKLCVVGLPSGEVRVCRPYHAKASGRHDLKPIGSAPIRDVEIEWSSKVTWIKPE